MSPEIPLHSAFEQFVQQLSALYSKHEAENIGSLVFEELFAVKKHHIRILSLELNTAEQARLQQIQDRLLKAEPLQYILGFADFYKYRFKVNPAVLIPRPETEELVEKTIAMIRSKWGNNPVKILDVGTGSGCIAISVKKELPACTVVAVDVSPAACEVAGYNAMILRANIHVVNDDILNPAKITAEFPFGVILSNPPYIAAKEKEAMQANVLEHEPHSALFVPDEDPLLFYRHIADLAVQQKNDCLVCVEINESLGQETLALFREKGLQQVELHQDLQGKDRVITAFA